MSNDTPNPVPMSDDTPNPVSLHGQHEQAQNYYPTDRVESLHFDAPSHCPTLLVDSDGSLVAYNFTAHTLFSLSPTHIGTALTALFDTALDVAPPQTFQSTFSTLIDPQTLRQFAVTSHPVAQSQDQNSRYYHIVCQHTSSTSTSLSDQPSVRSRRLAYWLVRHTAFVADWVAQLSADARESALTPMVQFQSQIESALSTLSTLLSDSSSPQSESRLSTPHSSSQSFPTQAQSLAVRGLIHDIRNYLQVASGWLTAATSSHRARDEGDNTQSTENSLDKHTDTLSTLADTYAELTALSTQLVTCLSTPSQQPGPSPSQSAFVPCSIADVASDVWAPLSSPADTLLLNTDSLPPVKASPALLRRFLANLFLNSIQHATQADGSGLTVTLDTLPATTQPSQQTSRSAVTGFSLCDDGPGLPDHVRSALSHTFSATTPQHTEPQLESGTGLAVVQQISAHHGWTLSLPDPAFTDGAQFNIRSVDFATE